MIGNQVWIESVRNGIFDPLQGDFGQPGVTVELLLDGQGIASTTTGRVGRLQLRAPGGGDYRVRVMDDWDVLLGYSVTVLGPQQGQDNNNQKQPYGGEPGERGLQRDGGLRLLAAAGAGRGRGLRVVRRGP